MRKTEKPVTDPELRRRIEELIDYKGGGFNEESVADIIENALKLLTDVQDSGDVRVIQTALRELRYAFKLFAPYAQRAQGHHVRLGADAAHALGVSAGGRVRPQDRRGGLHGHHRRGRRASCRPGTKAPGRRRALAPTSACRGNRAANPVIREDKKLVTFKYFFTRKLIFIRHSDAIALFPGGFGTMDEGYEALTLMQTGKSQLMPLVLIDRPGGTYWKTWDKHVREHLLRDQLISPDDLNLYQITDDTDQAVKIITRFYRNFHSSRFVKELFVIRLKHPPAESALEAMNEDFADLNVGPPIQRIEPTPEEIADDDNIQLPRIAFGFNRRDYGRLRQLIDVLNGL